MIRFSPHAFFSIDMQHNHFSPYCKWSERLFSVNEVIFITKPYRSPNSDKKLIFNRIKKYSFGLKITKFSNMFEYAGCFVRWVDWRECDPGCNPEPESYSYNFLQVYGEKTQVNSNAEKTVQLPLLAGAYFFLHSPSLLRKNNTWGYYLQLQKRQLYQSLFLPTHTNMFHQFNIL